MSTTGGIGGGIDSVLTEARLFPPRPAHELGFSHWHVPSLDEYKRLHARSIADPEGFWGEQAKMLEWFSPWSKVLEWKAPDAKWFVGGTLNVCHNCVDRHIAAGHGDEVGLIWEGEPVAPRTGHPAPGSHYGPDPEVRELTYRELREQTSRLGNVLRAMGVK
jgi:acetyl-CoA synthetase